MLRRKSLPVGALVMIMILALASIGVGYGLWSKVLYINGTVETGKVNVVFSRDEIDQGAIDLKLADPLFWEGDSSCDADGLQNDDCEYEGKNVADCTSELVGDDTLKVTVLKGYPSFNCWVQFDVHNTGSIPVKLHPPVITPLNFTNGKEVTVDLVTGFHGPTGYDPDTTSSECYHGTGVWDLDVGPDPYDGATGPHEHPQLHTGDTVYCVIHVHVEQAAEQNRTGDNAYQFEAKICAHQWNEETTDCVTGFPPP